LVEEAADLVSLPEVVTAVIQLAEDPRSTARDFEPVIAGDPNLAVRLLRVANSSRYSMRGRIDSIQRAVAVIGTLDVCNLAIGINAVRVFDGIPISVVSMADFWTHSVYCSVLARRLAHDAIPGREGTLSLAGLLHDVGQLLIFLRRPQQARRALDMVAQAAGDLCCATRSRGRWPQSGCRPRRGVRPQRSLR
jgi:HD-like signal output (HDOD) protein